MKKRTVKLLAFRRLVVFACHRCLMLCWLPVAVCFHLQKSTAEKPRFVTSSPATNLDAMIVAAPACMQLSPILGVPTLVARTASARGRPRGWCQQPRYKKVIAKSALLLEESFLPSRASLYLYSLNALAKALHLCRYEKHPGQPAFSPGVQPEGAVTLESPLGRPQGST